MITAIFTTTIYAKSVEVAQNVKQNYVQEPQVVAYDQYPFGSYKITAILDGTMGIPKAWFQSGPKAEIDKILKKYYEDQSQGVQTPTNTFLINKGNELIIIYSHAASCYGPISDSMHENLVKSGHQAE